MKLPLIVRRRVAHLQILPGTSCGTAPSAGRCRLHFAGNASSAAEHG